MVTYVKRKGGQISINPEELNAQLVRDSPAQIQVPLPNNFSILFPLQHLCSHLHWFRQDYELRTNQRSELRD